jgi:hypothetical protein
MLANREKGRLGVRCIGTLTFLSNWQVWLGEAICIGSRNYDAEVAAWTKIAKKLENWGVGVIDKKWSTTFWESWVGCYVCRQGENDDEATAGWAKMPVNSETGGAWVRDEWRSTAFVGSWTISVACPVCLGSHKNDAAATARGQIPVNRKNGRGWVGNPWITFTHNRPSLRCLSTGVLSIRTSSQNVYATFTRASSREYSSWRIKFECVRK